MIKGSGGVFEVNLDDELIYSKRTLGRFPEAGEIATILKPRLDS